MNTDVKFFATTVEDECKQQVETLASCPAFEGAKIRIMPDCHSGKGCVIGFTANLGDKVVPNVIGVDLGCFTGDTKVRLTDGRDITLEDLVAEYEQGKDNYCFCIDSNNHIRIEKIEYPRKIKVVDRLVEVTLDNGETVKCTEDHLFYLRSGKTVRADALVPGSKLMPLDIKFGRELDNVWGSKHCHIINGFPDYHAVYNPCEGRYVLCHRVADDYNVRHNVYDTETLKKDRRHHIDTNKTNNNPDNIIRLTSSEHWKLHAQFEKDHPELSVFGKMDKDKHREICSRAGKVGMKKNWANPEFRRKVSESSRNRVWSSESRKKISDAKKKNNPSAFKKGEYNAAKNPEVKWKIKLGKCRKSVSYLIDNGIEVTSDNFARVPKELRYNITWELLTRVADHYNISVKDIPSYTNHEVVSVRYVYAPNTPVYCLTNSEYGNFGLTAGVFVHNCGMYVCKLSTPVRDFEWFDKVVRQVVPMGFSLQDRKMCRLSDYNFTCFKKLKNKDRLEMSLGTLGGGNHFVELDEDSEGNQYLVVHSGSRNLGLQVCNIYQQRAKNAHEGEVPKDLEYLDGTLKDDYVHDMKLAQQFAVANREEMVKHICGKGQLDVEWSFHTVHNYLADDNVIRKGAISAKVGEVVYIPLNMRDGGVIAVGKGNSDWNNSAPHGAGRIMSRAKARDTLSVDEFKQQMTEANIWSSSVCEGTIDEAPGAYKPVEEILSVIVDTVDIVNTVKPVYNAKAVDSVRHRNKKEK